jgi:hypothetical protein
MSAIVSFLKKNGFKRMEKNSYANDQCNVVITKTSFEVADNDGCTLYSSNLSLFWLIGTLTYFELINKNYIK